MKVNKILAVCLSVCIIFATTPVLADAQSVQINNTETQKLQAFAEKVLYTKSNNNITLKVGQTKDVMIIAKKDFEPICKRSNLNVSYRWSRWDNDSVYLRIIGEKAGKTTVTVIGDITKQKIKFTVTVKGKTKKVNNEKSKEYTMAALAWIALEEDVKYYRDGYSANVQSICIDTKGRFQFKYYAGLPYHATAKIVKTPTFDFYIYSPYIKNYKAIEIISYIYGQKPSYTKDHSLNVGKVANRMVKLQNEHNYTLGTKQ